MSCSIVRCVAVVCAGLVVGSSAFATTGYNDRATFEAALAALTTDDFEDVLADITLTTTPTARTGYDLSVTSFTSSIGSMEINFPPPIAYLNSGSTISGHLHQSNGLIFDFDSPVSGFGFDYGGFDATLEVQLGDLFVTAPFTGAYPNGFFGVVSDAPFSTARIFNVSTANSDFTIDNVTFGSVPEPSAVLALVLGLTAAAGARRRC